MKLALKIQNPSAAILPSSRGRVKHRDVIFELPECHPAQHEFVYAFEKYPSVRFVVAACGSKFGKTRGACIRIAKEAWEGHPGKLCWWLAPTYRQAENAYSEIRRMLPSSAFKEEKANLALQLQTPSKGEWSRIEFKSGDSPNYLRGFGVHFLVVDEMARIKREAYLSAQTTQIKTMGRAMYLSTPKGMDDFHDLYTKGDKSLLMGEEVDKFPEYISFCLPTWLNPYIPPESIEQMRRDMLKGDFEQEVEAKFIDGAETVFRGTHDCIKGLLMAPQEKKRYVIGVDLARLRDYTCFVVMDAEAKHVVYFDHFQEKSWEMQKARIIALSKQYNNAMVVIDATAVGDAPAQQLAGLIPVFPFKISSNQAKRELIEKLRLSIEQRSISYPPVQTLVHELENYEMDVTTAGAVVYSAPRGKNDDAVIALALANWQLTQQSFTYRMRRVRL